MGTWRHGKAGGEDLSACKRHHMPCAPHVQPPYLARIHTSTHPPTSSSWGSSGVQACLSLGMAPPLTSVRTM